ncbi:MAG TPA: DNA repair protein RadA [Candidatus Saccharimonadales bacterium]|nr:DNA repair protein RadA [Candidatus Saccharimonadales bacterium]
MAKTSTVYICENCGYQSPQYLGKCPNCDSWNSLVETLSAPTALGSTSASRVLVKPQRLVDTTQKPLRRLKTAVDELDRVLGGGVVPGSVVLLAGDPGIGKSTLLLEVASKFHSLYVSGEESVEQMKLRSDRLGVKSKNLFVLAETDVDQIIAAAQSEKYEVIVVDSIQTATTSELSSSAGSVAQVREASFRLQRFAKASGVAVFIIGQITKEGNIAGPKVLEHLVDTVLFLEGDTEHFFRILSASKNRFGPVDEIGVFEMQERGIIEVKNPSKHFLAGRLEAPGSIVVPVLEGSRSVLTEIQALTNPTNFGLPIRRSFGFDQNRLQLLVATLIKRAGIPLQNQDIFINVAGGLKIKEPAADLAVCLAIASSALDQVISKDTVALGEVGLLGELRDVSFLDKRMDEAKRLGFSQFFTPKTVKTLKSAVDQLKNKQRA